MTKTPILLGKIGAAHGIKGEVRITSYTEDPLAIANYGTLDTDRTGLSVKIAKARQAKSVLIASLKGINDRNQAETLNGVSLYVDRSRLEEPEEDEFYHTDLIGLEVRQPDGTVLGTITAVTNFGADDLLDIRLKENGKSIFLPFTKAVVPQIDLEQGFVTAIPPEGWLEDTPRDPEDIDPEEVR